MNQNIHNETIVTTLQCNCRCNYCFQTNKCDVFLDSKIAQIRIDQLKNQLKNNEIDKLSLYLFGGEPMLNWTVFEMFLDNFANNKNVEICTCTNGTLITPERIEYFKSIKNFYPSISIDGCKLSNTMRITYDRKQTFDYVVDAIKGLRQANLPVNVTFTLNKFNSNPRFLEESFKFFKDIGVQQIYLQFMNAVGYSPSDDVVEKVLEIAEKYTNDKTHIMVQLIPRRIVVSDKVDNNVKHKDDELRYDLTPHGLLFSRLSVPTGKSGAEFYNVYFDEDLSPYNFLEVWDLTTNPIRHRVIHTKEEILSNLVNYK